jgi:iron complex outermembrane receptor protein
VAQAKQRKTGPAVQFPPSPQCRPGLYVGPGYALGLTGSLAPRAPTAEELYSGGVHHPTETFDKGDASLRKETSQNIDLSLQKTEDRLRWRANLFQNKVSNFFFGRIGV